MILYRIRSGRTGIERDAGGTVAERLDRAAALHVRLQAHALRRGGHLFEVALVDAGGLVHLETRVAAGRRDERVGHARPRQSAGGEILARLDRLEQRVGDVVIVDHEQPLDELLGVGGHAIAQPDLRVLAEHLHAVLVGELHLDVDHRAVQPLARVARDLGGLAARACARCRTTGTRPGASGTPPPRAARRVPCAASGPRSGGRARGFSCASSGAGSVSSAGRASLSSARIRGDARHHRPFERLDLGGRLRLRRRPRGAALHRDARRPFARLRAARQLRLRGARRVVRAGRRLDLRRCIRATSTAARTTTRTAATSAWRSICRPRWSRRSAIARACGAPALCRRCRS